MKASNLIKIMLLIAPLLSFTQVFADDPTKNWAPPQDFETQEANQNAEQANTNKQNAESAAIRSNTAAQTSHTAAQNANTASQNANTNTQNANTNSQNANTATQNANTATQNANTAAENSATAAQNANTSYQIANTELLMATPVPAPKESVTPPQGYGSCTTFKAGWSNGLWVPAHRVCKYTQSTEGVAWVEGYWACNKYQNKDNARADCTNWDWKPGHWVKTFSPY